MTISSQTEQNYLQLIWLMSFLKSSQSLKNLQRLQDDFLQEKRNLHKKWFTDKNWQTEFKFPAIVK